MKKMLLALLSLSLLLCLTACGSKMPYDLSGTASVELHAYDNDSTEPFTKIVVDGEDVGAIVEMFSSLRLKELDYTEPSINGYDFWFKDADGNEIAKLSLPYGPSPWVVVGATAYQDVNGGIDVDYLAQLVDMTVSAGPMQTGASVNQGAPEPEAYAFDAQYIRTDGYSDDRSYPYHTVISSRAELAAYCEAYKDTYNLERREKVYSDSTIGFLDACDKYDDAYFERQNLVLIVLQEGSGSVRHEITDVRRHHLENGASDGWDITIKSKAPEVVTDDMAQWHLFLEVQMGGVIKPTDKVWINGALSECAPAISGLVGISRPSTIEAYQDPWGVKLTAKNITPSGLTIVCEQRDGEPTGELNTGSYYSLEVLRDGEWVAVELLPMEGELAWTSEAWMIPANEEIEWDVDWSRLYGELPADCYRISKSVMDFRGTGDYDTKTYYAGFDLVDAADTDNVAYEYGGFGVSVPLLSGWEYKIEEHSAEGMSYGVSFRPSGEDGWIDFHYWPFFGVCGTGLETITYGNGSMGIYDGGAIWSFISYPASKGNFVATTQGVADWWDSYGEQAMAIIEQAICTDTIVD